MEGTYTGCIWQISTMEDNFDRFGGFLSVRRCHETWDKQLYYDLTCPS